MGKSCDEALDDDGDDMDDDEDEDLWDMDVDEGVDDEAAADDADTGTNTTLVPLSFFNSNRLNSKSGSARRRASSSANDGMV